MDDELVGDDESVTDAGTTAQLLAGMLYYNMGFGRVELGGIGCERGPSGHRSHA